MKNLYYFLKKIFPTILILFFCFINTFAYDFYWEKPQIISTGNNKFPTQAQNTKSNTSAVFWQEIEQQKNTTDKGNIWISGLIFSDNRNDWKKLSKIAGPFAYSGDIPNIISSTVSDDGTILLAIQSSANKIIILRTYDNGINFVQSEINHNLSLIAPRIYTTSKNSYLLFATKGKDESFSLLYATSENGIDWSDFTEFEPAIGINNPFFPVLCTFENKDLVIFQSSFTAGTRLSYQLYTTVSQDGGYTWSMPNMITGPESVNANQIFSNFHNQRPNAFFFEDKIYVAWERTYYSSENAQIYVSTLDKFGKSLSKPELISTGKGNAAFPILFNFDNNLCATWFDTRRGIETVYLAQKKGLIWTETLISDGSRESIFPLPIMSNFGNDLHIFWQQKITSNTTGIVQLSPDRTVTKPVLKAYSFTEGKRSTSEKISAQIVFPEDSSGIAGYSWIFTQDENKEPPKEFMNMSNQKIINANATEDGKWFLKVRVIDYAGNWSNFASLSYFKDTTPPKAPKITLPEIDEHGFVISNTFPVKWTKDTTDDDVAGYTYYLQHISEDISDINQSIHFNVIAPPPRILTSNIQTSFNNIDDGLYAFSVAAIDTVGNISDSSTVKLYLNKYIPYTTISTINTKIDTFGTIKIDIFGKGFTRDGHIEAIYIDKDGKEPYELVLTQKSKDYNIFSDKLIGNIQLDDIDEGNYKIGLMHSSRGLYMSQNILNITNIGTIKIGDYSHTFAPEWKILPNKTKYSVQTSDIILWSIFVIATLGLFFTLHGISNVAKDAFTIRHEVIALLQGDIMQKEKKRKTADLKSRGGSLRYKLIMFTAGLIMMIILLVSIPLGWLMTKNQEKTLTSGLCDRIEVLLDSMSSSARTYLPSENILELSFLPNQATALNEAKYATILGMKSNSTNTNLNYIWATNDMNISEKASSNIITFGMTTLGGVDIVEITEKCSKLNDEVVEKVGEMAKTISSLTTEAVGLALRTDKKSEERRNELQRITNQLSEKLTNELSNFSKIGTGSIPQFNLEQLDRENTKYLFYKPILYRQGSEQVFVRGIIVTEISTENLLNTIVNNRKQMIVVTGIIALIALLIGTVLTMLLASIIISPIKKLVKQVNLIARTGDKTKLEGRKIEIKSNDEIGMLGQSINTMTEELVENERNNQFLLGAQEVQRSFVPLNDLEGSPGLKSTVGNMQLGSSSLFVYYQGAKGVSGDYFDCIKLDDKKYAIIKCDVSGKGANAALIAAVVATLFKEHFKNSKEKKISKELATLAYKINDAIEAMNLKGKFAAYTLCIFDNEKNDLYFCNAGDNIINYYDATEGRKKTLTLPETPPAGPFPTFMIEMKSGYPTQKIKLNKGDVLFLYTDGIEEAKRLYKNDDGENIRFMHNSDSIVTDKEIKDAIDGEEMSSERVSDIIEAVFKKEKYILTRQKNPITNYDEKLTFDFSSCDGTSEDVIMALVCVEKVFRLYKINTSNDFETVTVDKKVDTFLQKHFEQYNYYCANKDEHPKKEYKDEYLIYKNILEDEQFDDLTLIALKI